MIYRRKTIKSIASAILLCFTSFTCAQPLYAIPANTQLPTYTPGNLGEGVTENTVGNVMNILQEHQTAVNKWDDFSIGADATVNFKGPDGFNSLNYVANGGPVSEIYGQLTALGGNIFIANPAGVQIGNSAQINVGSLYVTNKDIGDALSGINQNSETSEIVSAIGGHGVATANAELMSLGGIVAPNGVTFDGGRIVIDADRLYTDTDGTPLETKDNLTIKTTGENNVVIGYTADFDSTAGKFDGVNKTIQLKASESIDLESVTGYTWIKNLRHLQAMDRHHDGWFALRNSIETYYTGNDGYDFAGEADKKGFKPIGDDSSPFKGRFDGLGFDIFDLNIKRDGTTNVGLFGYAQDATIRNFTLNAGVITGGSNTGAVVGSASDSTIENIVNTADVKGGTNTGGVVGNASGAELSGLINVGTVSEKDNGSFANIGGIAGSINGGAITGTTYNLGAVTGTSNVGGIAGSAKNATIGNDEANPFVIYNELNVAGGYNVGGIAGSIEGTKVLNVANYGEIRANSSTKDTYSYHTADTTIGNSNDSHYIPGTTYGNGIASIEVQAANAGGIVGKATSSNATGQTKSSITNADNTGDVTTSTTKGDATVGTYYNAGNVGGIVGRAEDTSVTNSMNKENKVAGAHNVGGIAGYVTGNSTINTSVNNGGDITATGARRADDNGFAKESVRNNGKEVFNIGNIGGVVGYMYGDGVYVSDSSNRGTAHSAKIDNPDNILTISQAANAGGIAGKIDRSTTVELEGIKADPAKASVSGSYNTGDVQGYTGVGGVAGFMYNGEVTRSYNLGTITATRKASSTSIQPLNMGGIVGDTTEGTDARALVYDVYNAGLIGDPEYNLYGRHVGGVVGRLSGTVEKAYNTGDIYNGFNVVGGIAGWWYAGNIKDTFNTGNITVLNYNNTWSQVGGIVGAVNLYPDDKMLSYSYNLGTLRSFKPYGNYGSNSVGGIVGDVYSYKEDGGNTQSLSIKDVYTAGHLYAATRSGNDYTSDGTNGLGAVVAHYDNDNLRVYVTRENTNYIEPGQNTGFSTITNPDADNTVVYNDKSKADKYNLTELKQMDAEIDFEVDTTGWRLYGNGTPILNSFTPYAEEFFKDSGNRNGITSVQYGTAYNPLLTIINAQDDLEFNWSGLGISGAGGLAVYGNDSLTLNGFESSGANTYFGGMIYSDGALRLNGTGENFNLGSAASLYGSSVTLDAADGGLTIYGDVTSTNGDINITSGGDVEVIGRLKASLSGATTTIPGISPKPETIDTTDYDDPDEQMQTITERFSHTTTNAATEDGAVSVEADGAVQLLFGNLGKGNVTTGDDLYVKGSSVYIDTDLDIGKDFNLTSDGEILVDLSHMLEIGKKTLHGFLRHFKKDATTGDAQGSINVTGDDFKIAVDMWNYDDDKFDYTKYDDDDHTFGSDTDAIKLLVNDEEKIGSDYAYIWISDAEQLKGIQKYYSDYNDQGYDILSYNFALKNDIDASKLEDYAAIGTGEQDGFTGTGEQDGFTGTFDGRGFRIIGLTAGGTIDGAADTPPSSAGVFGKIGEGGTVKDLRVYASYFYGNDYAGTIAGINEGTITGVTTVGNHVEVFGSKNSIQMKVHDANGQQVDKRIGAAGGIAGYNTGIITDVTTSDSIVAGDSKATGNAAGGLDAQILTTAGGVAGINEGEISSVTADSALTADQNTTLSLGGVAGVNQVNDNDKVGTITGAYSTGVLHGEYGPGNITTNSAGGIAGINTGKINEVYNESDITGGSYVGGVVGYNYTIDGTEGSGIITDIANAGGIQSNATYKDDEGGTHYYGYTGGIAGYNDGEIDGGRNAGTINGGNYVGGMVGSNGANSVISNLVNSVFAAITGENYVGGIAGQNYGTIDAENTSLNNYGQVTGQQYVGGIAGSNEEGGEITNTISSIALHVKDDTQTAQYFGGVAGQNSGTIIGATNENDVDVAAGGATYVGGIVGENTASGAFIGEIANAGTVTGKANVGGIIGQNLNTTLLDNSNGAERLVITNSGNVSADEGGAAGIFYNNSSAIVKVDLSNAGEIKSGTSATSVTGGLFGTNSGEIKSSTLANNGLVEGGGTDTGGIIGKNTGNAENSVFTNNGTVSGAGNAGGLFGSNSGDFNNSSLFATVGAKVTGTGDNVGGLIGYNTGTIKGGRGEGGNGMTLYKYRIYNNGSVEGANNVGGLIGHNADETDSNGTKGYLYAGYNTGVATATGDNAGGIVGNNEGTVSSVFNTIMTLDGNKNIVTGSVTGATNVGGLIGMNSGTLSDAYNTTDVIGTETVGNAVGDNAAGGTVSNVYATNADGKLIGENNASEGNVTNVYTFAANDNSAAKIEDDQQKLSASYDGFDFSGTGDVEAVWKNYDGWSTPMLKVFLTEATYDSSKEKFIYNADEQRASVKYVTMADDTAYNNVHSLLSPTTGNKNAGTYMAFYSGQIAGSGEGESFNPNNLGYDIDAKYSIGKATIGVELEDLWRVYGDKQMYGDKERQHALNDYSELYRIEAAGADTVLNDAMRAELNGGITLTKLTDQAVVDDLLTTQRATNDAGDYEWTAKAGLVGDTVKSNYQFNADGADNIVLTGTGKSHVEKADLNIVLSNVSREYGTAELSEGCAYGIESSSGLTNGDATLLSYNTNYNVVGANNDGAVYVYAPATSEVRTHNAGDYTWTVAEGDYTNAFSGINTGNYNITVTDGGSKVTPKTLNISNVLATIVYGDQDGKGLTVNEEASLAEGSIVYGDDVELAFDGTYSATGAYEENRGTRKTADVGMYGNSLKANGLVLIGNDAGNYTLADTDAHGSIEVTQAALTVSLSGVSHTYGNHALTNGTSYGIANISGVVNDDSYTYADLELGTAVDDALVNDGTALQTKDVGDYKWTTSVTSNIALLNQNYKIEVREGDSAVAKAPLTLNINDVSTVYGTAFDEGKYGYSMDGVTNGDSPDVLKTLLNVAYKNDAALDGTDGRVTKDAGTYGIDVENRDALNLHNYNITEVKKGTATVDKVPLEITLNNVTRTYGDSETFISGIGYGYNITGGTKLVNGDENKQLILDADAAKEADSAIYEISDKWRTWDAGSYDYLTGIEDAFSGVNLDNYDVKYYGGQSVVKPKELNISNVLATIVYGDQGDKGFNVTVGELTGFAEGYGDEGSVVLNEKYFSNVVNGTFSEAYENSQNGRKTADAGTYVNGITYSSLGNKGLLSGEKANNYVLADTATGDVEVTKAVLTLTPNDATTVYGTAFDENSYSYTLSGVANDDSAEELKSDIGKLEYANYAAVEGQGTKHTLDANEEGYIDAISITGLDKLTLTNYTLKHGDKGTAIVTKAPLTITLNDVKRTYGDTAFIEGTDYGIAYAGGLVNGDEKNTGALKLKDGAVIEDGGLLAQDRTNDANDKENPTYTWTVAEDINSFEGIDKLSRNYIVDEVIDGGSTVTPKELNISNVLATIVYGDQDGAGFKIAGGGELTGIVYDDDVSLSKGLKIEDAEFAAGGAYESNRNGRATADAGIYDNEALTFGELTLSGTKAGNYTLNKEVAGDISVEKAVLTLTPNDATTVYGKAFDEASYGYTLSGVTNEDNDEYLMTAIGALEYGNDAAFDGEGGKYTANAGIHYDAVYIKNLNGKMLTNYTLAHGGKGTAIINRLALDVALNSVERTYGGTTLTDGDYSVNTNWLDKLVNGDKLIYTGDEVSISEFIGDEAVIGEYTNNAGEHSWSAKVDAAELAQNYEINEIATGSSIVNKAKLAVNAGHAETTYGTPFDKDKYYYDLVGVTNGDSDSEIKAQIGDVVYDNTAAIEDGGDRVTDNAGVNGVLSILTDLFGIELGNYEIEAVNEGTATVEKADLFVKAHDKLTRVGREPEYTGTTLEELNGSLVNGDVLSGFIHTFGIEEAEMLNNAGHYPDKIGAVVNGLYYYDGTHDWSGHHDVFANYDVNVEAGSLRVFVPAQDYQLNYGWLYDDAPYSRKRNFRERKAEIYFQDGGMEYDENM